ncbi:hypothetical protein, partial [Verminephrobacter aporrectodeae]|uniref:hypothetical protein n=1 Tax=Verminephrobacter aporrectodeae TaxID=1110389 RepID=UPI002242CDAE
MNAWTDASKRRGRELPGIPKSFPDHLIVARLARCDAGGEVTARDFLERQKAVAVFAVIDEAGFQRRLDAR